MIQGTAPEALTDLPVPDAVFIGGSGGCLKEILELLLRINPDARLCISAILTETLGTAAAVLTACGVPFRVTQIGVTESSELSGKHMMKALDPVWLVWRE